MDLNRSLVLDKLPSLAERVSWMVPVAAGIFLGTLLFDAMPVALANLGAQAWVWAAAGFGVMFISSWAAGERKIGWMASIASAGVWLHSLLEGVAAGTGGAVAAGGAALVALGLIMHLIPESAALFTLTTAAGLSTTWALVRCVVTWGLVIAGFLGAQLLLGRVPVGPMGVAMGLAAGAFGYLAWALWQHRSPHMLSSWVGAAVGVAWVAAIHIY